MTISRAISQLRQLLRRQVHVVLLGFAAAAVLSLPPLAVATRLDALLYDILASWRSPAAPDDVILVTLTDPAWLGALGDLTAEKQSRLLVTTLAQPPSSGANGQVLGPTEVPIGAEMIRRTDWIRGGHLDFAADKDGMVRALPAWLAGDEALPSLALAAFHALGDETAPTPRQARLRLIEPDAYTHLSVADTLATPDRLSGAIVVAGRSEPRLRTPVGSMASHELLAQAIQGYRDGSMVTTIPAAGLLPWIIALATFAAMLLCRSGHVHRALLVASGALLVLLAGSGALLLFSVWIPVTAAMTFLLTTSALLLDYRRQPAATAIAPALSPDKVHTALAEGDIELAWREIQGLPGDRANLDQICDFAEALEAHRYMDLAADTYHRAALIDPRHRDVARRLIRTSQTPTEREAANAAAKVHRSPATLSRYELLEPIGRGTTGMVHLAVDPTINRLVALKVINLRAEYDAESLEEGLDRFHREAASAGRLKHPNIVTIFDIDESDGLAFIAMEFLSGRHLSHFTTEATLLPPRLVLDLGADIAEALDYAHGRNVVHRDIKPANIMYDSVSGSVTITDFGIARLIDVSRTRTGIVLGTPSFMAPEQLEGKNVNRHTDLFALGVTIYELLSGRLPFLGASMTKLMFVIANDPHPPITALRPGLPSSLNSLFDQALAKCPEDRFARGADMAAALRHAASQIV